MSYIIYALTAAAFLYVVFTLIMGAKHMGGKAENSRELSNLWMQRRVKGQLVAVGLLMFSLYLTTKS